MKATVSVLIAVMLLIILFSPALACEKVYWCHCEPNGNCQTLYIAEEALQNAGHMDARGNPLHAGDYAGQCTVPTADPTVEPTIEPTPDPTDEPTLEPTDDNPNPPIPTEEVTEEPEPMILMPSTGAVKHTGIKEIVLCLAGILTLAYAKRRNHDNS